MVNGKHTWPFSGRYAASSKHGNEPGIPILCRARPAVGGHFALLALGVSHTIQSLSDHRRISLEPERQRYLSADDIEEL